MANSGEIRIELGVKEEQARASHSRVRGLRALADLCAYSKTEAARECIYSLEDLLDVKLQGNERSWTVQSQLGSYEGWFKETITSRSGRKCVQTSLGKAAAGMQYLHS